MNSGGEMNQSEAINLYLEKAVHAMVIINRLQRWDHRMTLGENASNLNIGEDLARQMVLKWGMSYKRIRAQRVWRKNV